MTLVRKLVVGTAAVVFGLWLLLHLSRVSGPQHGVIRLVLGLFFALCIILRSKPPSARIPSRVLPAWLLGIGAALLAVLGIVFDVNQFEWLGLVILLYTALRWGLPARYSRDIFLGLFILYWMHPLPGQLFAPLQFFMQWISVEGSEAVLHAFNARAWADQFTLHTGLKTFEVPAECSGMKTATTVLMCTLGVTALLRLRWYEIGFFLVLGLLQVLALNIARISFMVVWSARMPPAWSSTFLHDTLGIFLLVSVVLTQVEASWWKAFRARRARRRREIEEGEIERPEKATILPRFWVRVMRMGWVVSALLIISAGLAVFVYKSRTYHHVAMVRDVANALIDRNPVAAQKAVEECLRFYPGDRDLLSARLEILVMRGKYERALAMTKKIEDNLSAQDMIWKSWALLGLDRIEEASELVRKLPKRFQSRPAVAIIRAEYAAMQDEPKETAKFAVIASGSTDLQERVRGLFPYLAVREQWDAIAEADRLDIPYRDIVSAVLAVKSYRQTGDFASASQALLNALEKWPEDPRFLQGLFDLAVRRPGSKWEDYFASTLKSSLDLLHKDELASYIQYGFRLNRPDLAWLVYIELKERDPSDPALYVAAARYCRRWFVFRRHFLGLGAENVGETVDLRPFYRATKTLWPLEDLWQSVPLGEEMASQGPSVISSKYLSLCLAELERRRKRQELGVRLKLTYPVVLGMAGRYEEAHRKLDELLEEYPEKKHDIVLQKASFYHNEAEWDKLYETLRAYRAEGKFPNLNADLMLVNSMVNLNLGVTALHVARQGRERFPGAAAVENTIAAIWDIFGYKERALFILQQAAPGRITPPVVQLLYDTGRFQEAEKRSRALGLNLLEPRLEMRQSLFPAPAERVVERRWDERLSSDEMKGLAASFEQKAEACSSPFVRKLRRLRASWYEAGGRGGISDPDKWLAAGRNNLEKAAALHHLSGMQGRQKMYEDLVVTAGKACELLPESPILHRTMIAATEGEPGIIQTARKHCPEDPHVWLASLVDRARRTGSNGAAATNLFTLAETRQWMSNTVSRAVSGRRYSAGTMTRAGDFLLRSGYNGAAILAARDAVDRAQGLVAAYALGIRASLRAGDADWGLQCALRGVEHAKNATPFYKTMVAIKNSRDAEDEDLVSALQHLRKVQPAKTAWAERLGDVYFERGDTKRALTVLGPTVQEHSRGVRVSSLLTAAEAARLEGRPGYAIDILEAAHSLYPDRVSVLNNLIYTLAQQDHLVSRARAMVPTLLEQEDELPAVLDTAALVYRRSGDIQEARRLMRKALENLGEEDDARAQIRINAAELALESGDYAEARKHLDNLVDTRDRDDMVTERMRVLMRELRERGAE